MFLKLKFHLLINSAELTWQCDIVKIFSLKTMNVTFLMLFAAWVCPISCLNSSTPFIVWRVANTMIIWSLRVITVSCEQYLSWDGHDMRCHPCAIRRANKHIVESSWLHLGSIVSSTIIMQDCQCGFEL